MTDTIKHMWDQVEKARADGTFSSPTTRTQTVMADSVSSEANIITGAMAIARVRGHDPDEPAPLSEMCTHDNAPVPWWMVFVEEAEACLQAVAPTLTTSLAAASARIGELETFLRDFADWCSVERHKLGAVDGYDYRSGEEYGLRRAEIEIEKRIDARRSALSQTEEGRTKIIGRVTGTEYEGDQVPGMPGAICHACGLKSYPCTNPDCPKEPARHE